MVSQLQIVSRPLLWVLQNMIGGEDLPQLLLGGRVTTIEVRVARLGGPVKRHLDGLFTGASRHAKNIVSSTHCTSLTSLCRPPSSGERLKRSSFKATAATAITAINFFLLDFFFRFLFSSSLFELSFRFLSSMLPTERHICGAFVAIPGQKLACAM